MAIPSTTLSPEAIDTINEFDKRLTKAQLAQQSLLAKLRRTGNSMLLLTGCTLSLSWLLQKQGYLSSVLGLLMVYSGLMSLLFWRWWQYIGPYIDVIAGIIEPFREYVYLVAQKQGWKDTFEYEQFQNRLCKFLIAQEPDRRNQYSFWQRLDMYWHWSWELLSNG